MKKISEKISGLYKTINSMKYNKDCMVQTDNGKNIFDFVIAFMGSIFLTYPAIKDVLENKDMAVWALVGSILFSGGIIGLLLFISMKYKLFEKK